MLTPALIIQKKRDGEELTQEEIRDFIRGVSSGEVADYQATAFLMAVYFRGMTLDETVALTEAMLESGDRYRLDDVFGPKVDKHSTGGVGDKVSLILAPLAAACGLRVPMMSGRGLGHTGGTLDKLESINGFDVRLPFDRFKQVLNDVGCAMIGQTDKIAPADKKLYALRDVTGTVECIPLITASILSKKLAEGADALVLDVKVGNGAFMKSRESARKLAKTITQVTKKMGMRCRAVLTDMNQPLGYAVGNAIEMRESIEIMRRGRDTPKCKEGPSSCDLRELTIQLCAHMLEVGGAVRSLAQGRKLAIEKLTDGSCWKVFQELVKAQGGDLDQILHPERLAQAPRTVTWTANRKGFITKMDTQAIGRILVELGGGRKKASDNVDYGVGFEFHRKLGAKVRPGDTIAIVHAPEHLDLAPLETLFAEAVEISNVRKPVPKLILEVLGN